MATMSLKTPGYTGVCGSKVDKTSYFRSVFEMLCIYVLPVEQKWYHSGVHLGLHLETYRPSNTNYLYLYLLNFVYMSVYGCLSICISTFVNLSLIYLPLSLYLSTYPSSNLPI